MNVTPECLEQFINTDKLLAENTKQLCQLFFQLSPQAVLKNISGVWRAVIVCDEGNNLDNFHGIHGALTIPDKQGKLFAALVSKLKFMSAFQIDQQKKLIKFPAVQGYAFAPVIRGGNENITIFTSPGAAFRTAPLSSFPQRSAFLSAWQKRLVPVGVAAFYIRNAVTDVASKNLDTATERPSWQVLKRLNDGFLSTDLTFGSLNEHITRTAMILPLQFFFDIFLAPQQPLRKQNSGVQAPQKRSVKVQTASSKHRQPPCLEGISKAGKALVAAANKNKQWPVYGIAGLRQLVTSRQLDRRLLCCPLVKPQGSAEQLLSYANCHYLYFGKPGNNSPKTPILIELPFLHREYVAVFYADGKAEKIHLSGQRNARRAVSYLHTLHSYEEEEFMRLMQLAGEFDKILEL